MRKLLFLFFVVLSTQVFSQGSTCPTAAPFCAGASSLIFPNTTGQPNATPVSCMNTQPNPAWFYMQVGNSGNLLFDIVQNTNFDAAGNPTGTPLDVDFVAWGPFNTGDSFCSLINTADCPTCPNNTTDPNFYPVGNVIDCSWSGDPVETLTIDNAVSGQIYIVLITNFDGDPGFIKLVQTNSNVAGAGSTDCDILCPLTVNGGGTFCPGSPATLTATINGLSTPAAYAGATFAWTSTVPGFVPPPTNVGVISVNQPGTYTVVVNKPGCVPNGSASATYTSSTPPTLGTPINPLTVCIPSTTYNLTLNTPVIANGSTNLASSNPILYHNSQLSANDGSSGGEIFPTPSAHPGNSGDIIYVSIEDNASCIYTTSFTLAAVNCCDTVSANTGTQSVCLGGDPTTLTATTTATGTNSISFVYFPTQQTGSNMYTGGTLLSNVTPVGGVATFDPPVLGPTSIPNAVGTYYVYAILNPIPTNASCRDFEEIIVTVNNLPNAGADGSVTICDSNTAPIDLNTLITGQQVGGTWSQATGTGGSFNTATGIFTPASGATTSTFTYTINGVAPCVTDTSTATVTINPQPNAGSDGTITVCDSSTAAISLASIITGEQTGGTWIRTFGTGGNFNAAAGTFTPAPGTTGSTFEYTMNATAPCVTDFSIATINFTSPPVITTPTPYQVCDDNNDGFSSLFFLHTKDSEIGPATLTYEYYETLTNAQLGAPVNIITQNPYPNISPNTQTLFVRVYDAAAPTCYSITTLQLIVNPRPSINSSVTDYELCDVTAPAGDGVEVFTLNSKNTEIANGQSLANFTINYYLTQAHAIAYTTSPTLPNLYSSSTQTIWYNISNNTTGCNSVGSFNLVVNPLPQVVAPPPMFECSNGVVMTAAFDLNLNNNTISPTGGTAVTYHLSLAEANLGINDLAIPYTNATNPQTVWVRVESTTTGCFDTTSLQLNVTQGPVANTPSPLQICDPNNDGFGVFNLNLATAQIVGATPTPAGVSVSYHETQTDAETGANAITGPYSNITAWSQIIYVRVFYTLTNCANYVQLKLNVNPTPIATDPADYHLCDDNYDGVVSFNLTSINPQVLNNLDPATHNVTYHTSLLDAQNDANPITNIASYQSGNTTLWIRVEIIATGCYDVVDFQLVVDPLPLSTQPAYPPYNLCDVNFPPQYEQFNLQSQVANILLGQTGMSVTFYPSLGEANAQINAITNTTAYVNVPPVVQTLGVVITNSATGCYVVSTMDIRVEPLPTPIAPLQPYVVCDANQDGFAQFDLCTLTPAINTGGYIITYHETLADAQAGNNPLPCIYQNIFAFTQIIWVGAEDTLTGCRNTMPIVLQVDPSPIMPTTIPNITLCDEDANNQDGITQVDLEQQTAAILAVQTSPGSNYTVTYYTSQANATSGPGNEIVASSTYQGSDNQVIWVRIEHNTTGCFTIGSFTLEINIPLQLTTPAPLSVCDNDANPNDLHTTFNLTVKNNQITNNLPGYIVTYYPSYGDALAGTNVITTPTGYVNVPPAVQTLGVMVTSAEGCRSYTTLNIRVLPVPTPNTNPQQLAAQCENALDSGVQTFDITTNAAYIINGDPNVTLHYYHSLSDATSVPPINEILNPTAALIGNPALLATNPRALNLIQNVYVVVSSNLFVDYNAQNCYTVVAQPFIINPLPVVVPIGAQTICEDDPLGVNDGFEVFDLTSYIPQLIAGNATQPTSNYNVTFYTDAALTNQISSPSAYTNVTNPQLIYAQVTNTTTGCSNSGAFDIIVNPKPDLAAPNDFATCDDELNDNDGFYQYPLDILITGILNGQSPTDYTVSFYNTSQADADSGTNAIANLPTYQAQTQTIWIRVENNLTGCYQIGSFDIIIEQYAAPIIETVDNINTICVNFITNVVERELTLFASNTTVYLNTPVVPQPGYDYQWYVDGNIIPGAIAPGYTINTPLANNTSAVFTVVMTSTSPLGCSTTSQSFTVLQSGPAVPLAGTVGYTVTDAFSDNQIITVTVDGWGSPNYQYSLDDGPRQDSPIFENVSLGSHLITVWDTKGGLNSSCDALFIQYVATIDYPHYFTPNGDGIHDTWNIVGLDGQPSTKIYIFDRFGKLLKQISSTGEGWDGTFNGEPLPSTDYWFTVDYNEQNVDKQFKAHFSLKR